MRGMTCLPPTTTVGQTLLLRMDIWNIINGLMQTRSSLPKRMLRCFQRRLLMAMGRTFIGCWIAPALPARPPPPLIHPPENSSPQVLFQGFWLLLTGQQVSIFIRSPTCGRQTVHLREFRNLGGSIFQGGLMNHKEKHHFLLPAIETHH